MGYTKPMKVQYARIQQPFGADPPIMHCPICGKAAFTDGELTICKHFAFIYMSATDEFVYTSDDFTARAKISLKKFTIEKFEKLLNCLYENELLAIEITYGGMNCGPVMYQDVYGFDFATIED